MKKFIVLLSLLTLLFCNHLSAQTDQTYQLSTHILDISKGKPAPGISISLFRLNTETQTFEFISSGNTDENGRIGNFLPSNANNQGIYKLKFETLGYFTNQGISSIYPYIEVIFQVEGNDHYHIPITVSANGYSTYRGS